MSSCERARATRERTVPTGQPRVSDCLLVAEPEELRQDEGLPPVVVEWGQQVGDRLVDGRDRLVGGGPGAHVEAALALTAAHVVGADVAADGQQPGPHPGLPPEVGEGA